MPGQTQLCPAGQRNFSDFMNRFGKTMPHGYGSVSKNNSAQQAANKAKTLAEPPFWYSFDYGSLHVAMINTETDFPSAPDGPGTNLNGGPIGAMGQQLEWLDADLSSVDRTVTPWVVVAGHRPWYSTGGSKQNCEPCRKAFEPTLYKYGVDVAVFGHVHNSQATAGGVYNNTADPAGLNNPKAPMYVVSGGTGNIEGLTRVGEKQSYNAFAYDTSFSYASFTFKSAKELIINFYRSDSGEKLHTSTLRKEHKQAFVRQ